MYVINSIEVRVRYTWKDKVNDGELINCKGKAKQSRSDKLDHDDSSSQRTNPEQD